MLSAHTHPAIIACVCSASSEGASAVSCPIVSDCSSLTFVLYSRRTLSEGRTMTRISHTTGNHTPRWGNWIVGIHLPLYRLTNGLLGHHLGQRRTLLLTTIGRRSGRPR